MTSLAQHTQCSIKMSVSTGVERGGTAARSPPPAQGPYLANAHHHRVASRAHSHTLGLHVQFHDSLSTVSEKGKHVTSLSQGFRVGITQSANPQPLRWFTRKFYCHLHRRSSLLNMGGGERRPRDSGRRLEIVMGAGVSEGGGARSKGSRFCCSLFLVSTRHPRGHPIPTSVPTSVS